MLCQETWNSIIQIMWSDRILNIFLPPVTSVIKSELAILFCFDRRIVRKYIHFITVRWSCMELALNNFRETGHNRLSITIHISWIKEKKWHFHKQEDFVACPD